LGENFFERLRVYWANTDTEEIKNMSMNERIWAVDSETNDIIYRISGHQHGDGQIDTDENPVWILADPQIAKENGIDIDTLPRVNVDE
jgi:hypothetical protein